jgi:hypothetical protein
MRSMQGNVEFGYQLNICSGTKENTTLRLIAAARTAQKTSVT